MNRAEQEKRKSARVERNITIQYRIKELPGPKEFQLSTSPYADITYTINLSEKGTFFTAAHPIPVGTVLAIKLRLPTHPEGPFDLEGRVVECEDGENKLVFGVRLEFVNLKEEYKQALKKFVEIFLPEK